ncbi:ComEA family DNA-binding protein [Corynebacterium aquatimens]|uniref:ComEA family DNA-binding protein n=1 Tax=Corynebacterium aquatimens TaxID=1190508 RepID=UPI0033143EA4
MPPLRPKPLLPRCRSRRADLREPGQRRRAHCAARSGDATAHAIVSHREANGPFATLEGLMDVKGIGPAKFDALKDLVCL